MRRFSCLLKNVDDTFCVDLFESLKILLVVAQFQPAMGGNEVGVGVAQGNYGEMIVARIIGITTTKTTVPTTHRLMIRSSSS